MSTESQAFNAFSRIQALLNDNLSESSPHFEGNVNFEDSLEQNGQSSALSIIPIEQQPNLFKMNFNEESFESKLHPDELKFHEILWNTMERSDSGIFGRNTTDNLAQADIAAHYASTIQKRYIEVSQQSRRNSSEQAVDSRSGWKSSVIQRELSEVRAERDLWSLLEILTMSNLLDDINDEECDANLNAALSALPVVASVPDFVNAAYSSDLRIRKGAVLKEWLEKAALDRVNEAPISKAFPGSETLSRITRDGQRNVAVSQSLVQSLHPDGQLTESGLLLPLDGVDRLDQELLLKTVWQLIRSGQILKAQQVAADHHVYWLAASLQGAASHYHKQVMLGDLQQADPLHVGDDQNSDPSMVVGVARVGNLKQPVWTRTCWKHSSRLAAQPGNWNCQVGGRSTGYDSLQQGRAKGKDDSLVGVLELSIYAALCNNTKVLVESPLLSSWHDRVWTYLKAAHERDLSKVVHRYRCVKSAHSSLYPGCELSVIAAERELLDWGRAEVGHMSTGSCVQIFNKVPPPSSRTAESLLLKLQAAVMEGRSGVLNYIENTMVPLLRETDCSIPGLPLLLRVFCHFAIWLKYSPSDSSFTGRSVEGTNMSDLVSDEVLFLAVESYVDHLIERKQRTLVAAYVVFLDRTRRIAKYADLLRSVQASVAQTLLAQQMHEPSGQSADAAEVLQMATLFFPGDVMDITRAVVERGFSPAPAQILPPRGVRFNDIPSGSPVPSTPLTMRTPTQRSILDDDETSTPAYGRFNALRGRQATPRPSRGQFQSPESDVDDSPPQQQLVLMSASRPATLNKLSATPDDQQRDVQQMEALRWLFFDPAHRVEAVKQTNRLATSFLAESEGQKLHQVRTLLTSYLPYDSVVLGSTLLARREKELGDIVADHLNRQIGRDEEDAAAVGQMQAALDLDAQNWLASVAKLELWRSLVGAMEDFDAHKNLLAEYSAAASRLVGSQQVARSSLGRFRAKIERLATVATDALMRTVICGKYSPDFENPAVGYRDIWNKADSACVSSAVSLAESILAALNTSGESGGGGDLTPAADSVLRELDDALTMANFVFSPHQRESPQIARLLELLSLLPERVAACGFSSSDLLLHVSSAASQIRLSLVDLSEGQTVRAQVLNQLLSTYLLVCSETAAALESLEHFAEACEWYSRGIQLANVIATDDESLRLYEILNRRDLEAILSSVNELSMKLLALDPDFNIG